MTEHIGNRSAGMQSLLKNFSPLRAFVAIGCLSLAFTTNDRAVSAQEKSKPKDTVKPVMPDVLTKAVVETRIKEAQEISDEKLKTRVLDIYKQALDPHLKNAERFEKQVADFVQLRKNVGNLVKDLNKKLEEPIKSIGDPADGALTLPEMERRLTEAKQEQSKAKAELDLREGEPALRASRRAEVPKRQAQVSKELKEAEDALNAKPQPGLAPEETKALRTLQQAQRLALLRETTALEMELPTYDATVELMTLQIRAANRAVIRTERKVNYWEKLVEDRRSDEARNQELAAESLLNQFRAENRPDQIIKMAEENLKLARIRTGKNGLVARIRTAVEQTNDAEKKLEELKASRKAIEEKLKIPDIEEVIGPQLVDQLRQLPHTGPYQRRIVRRTREASQVRVESLDIQKRSKELDALDSRVQQFAAEIKGLNTEDDRQRATADVKTVLAQRQKLLDSLSKDYSAMLTHLGTLSSRERQLIDEANTLRKLIDKHILWIPSTTPLSIGHWDDVRNAFNWLLNGSRWQSVSTTLQNSLFASPVISALAVFLLALALLKEKSMRERLHVIGERSGRRLTEPFILTIQALALTIALSAIWPMTIWFVGWHLTSFSGTTEFAESVGFALQAVAFSLLTLEFLRRLFRPLGVADAHFRWRDSRQRFLRRHLRWFAAVVLPAEFLFVLINDYAEEQYSVSLGRLLLIGILLTCTAFLAIILRSTRNTNPPSKSGPVDHAGAAKRLTLFQMGAYITAVGFPLCLVILAWTGYFYTSVLLTKKLLQTAWLGVVLLIFHAMAVRWLYYARGILALSRTQTPTTTAVNTEDNADSESKANAEETPSSTSREGQSPAAESSNNVGDAKPKPAARVAEEIESAPVANLATINSQTRRILKIAVGSAAFLGLWLIWADVLPALKFLDYPMWSTQTETTKMVPGADGVPVPQRVPMLKVITSGGLLWAIAILVVACVAAVNIPGLLEIGVLQKLPIDYGARYAIATLARYSIYIAGIAISFNLMGFSWGKVQWLVAAVGVGLGFGLQEVFANFVCGLILLFERPLRVGDVVTIGDVSGTVTRIQIRATTVRNWDRKEYIVPNKDLITGKLLNWTLTDHMHRIVVNVGVAYGCDGDVVREILLKVAADHPQITAEPPPSVTFEGFGDSALNFTVRCYITSLERRLETIHELHTTIQRKLNEAGIEIAFPQRDLHIRSDDTLRDRLRSLHENRSIGNGGQESGDKTQETMSKET